MKLFLNATVAAVAFLFNVNYSTAQFQSNGYEIGIHAGTLVYQGDLAESALGNAQQLKLAAGIWVSKSLDNYFAVRAGLTRGRLVVDEARISDPEWRHQRAFQFTTPIIEFSATLHWHMLGKTNATNLSRFSPYVFAGAGLSFLNIKRDWTRMDINVFNPRSAVAQGLGADTLNSTPRLLPVLPVGAGVQYAISPRLALNLESTYRFTGSDYLDGFKHAANPSKKDSYYGVLLGLSFSLGTNRYNCPKAW